MSEFDSKARDWDKNPANIERAEAIATAIKKRISICPDMKALEYGAGTGLLSFALRQDLSSVTMMDSSREMVAVMEEKVKLYSAANLRPIFFDLETNTFDQRIHFIFNQMVLHHVHDVKAIFMKFHHLLLPGGYLAIADLYPEDGSFHGHDFNGHKGFDPEQLAIELRRIGFEKIDFDICYRMKKQTASGEIREYPIFLLTAKKQIS